MIRTVFLLAALAAMSGCIPKADPDMASGSASASQGSAPDQEAPTLDIAGGCKADSLQSYLGQTLTRILADQLQKEAGAQVLRVGHETDMTTMDYNSGRLNITYNDDSRIVRLDCG